MSSPQITPSALSANETVAGLDERIHRCFMDGIDWQHHLEADASGTRLFPCITTLKRKSPCIDTGGCGVVEVEVRFIRWVEPQDLDRDPEYQRAISLERSVDDDNQSR